MKTVVVTGASTGIGWGWHTVTPEAIQNLLATTLPKRFLDAMIARQMGLK
jgi:hypothetical protein